MLPDRLEELVSILGPDPRVQALLILLVAFIASRLAGVLLTHALPRLSRRTRTELDDQIFALLRPPVSVTILLVGLHLALLRLAVAAPFDGYGRSLLATVAIFIWLSFSLRFSKLLLAALSRQPRRFAFIQPPTLPVFENTATVVITGGAVYFLLIAWGASVSGLLASAGIVGLALGLAAKDTLANFFAGIAIMADAPFSVGDFIVLESGERGEITRIGLRSSRLLTRDDLEIILPNSMLANSKIINEAGGPARRRRVRIKVQVAYGSDIDRVREVLMDLAKTHPQVCREPLPRVRFRAFEDSGLRFELLAWVSEPVLRGRVIDALNTEVYKRFAAAGITLPFPQLDLYIRQVPPPAGEKPGDDPAAVAPAESAPRTMRREPTTGTTR